jgi:ssDNA-binding replication factor A large subunit
LTKSCKKQPIIIHSTTKNTSDCIVADETGTIKVVLWEEMIDKIQAGKSYHITNLKVRMFDDEKFVNTNESTIA